MYKLPIILFFIFSAIFCSAQKKALPVTNADVDKLYKLMKGSYSSELQSISDSDYYDIRLQMKPMWKHIKGSHFLYVEQAMSTSVDSPYRQRVYELKLLNDTTISSTVYTIKGGAKYYGDFKKKEPLKNCPIDSLELRNGCAIYLHKIGKSKYAGSTNEADCESSLRGASYATSEVKISKKKVVSWDRGFNKNKEQVWGAKKGGYKFMKITNKKVKSKKVKAEKKVEKVKAIAK